MKEKQLYTAPEAELFVVRFEENICASEFGAKNWTSGSSSWWLDLDDDE